MKKPRMTILLVLALACVAPVVPTFAADETPDYIEEMRKWQPKAEAGDAEAQFQLGQMYALGHGFKQNFKTAAEWYAKSAEQGNAKARTALALCYGFGNGVEHNLEIARSWFEKAAAQDFSPAQVTMGRLAEKETDYAKARKWYDLAVAQGNAEAMANIGDLYKNGKGVSKDMKQAIQWYEKAASQEKPSADALSSLSLLYRDGTDVAKDEKKAGELLEKACNLGDA